MILRCSYQDYKAFKVSTRIKNSFINFQLSLFDELENQDWCLCLRCCNYEYLPVMHIKDFGFRRVGFGWTTNIPFQKGILESHRDFVDSNILYFGEVAAPPVALVERIEKNYGIKNELVIVNKNEWFALYKFVSKWIIYPINLFSVACMHIHHKKDCFKVRNAIRVMGVYALLRQRVMVFKLRRLASWNLWAICLCHCFHVFFLKKALHGERQGLLRWLWLE